MTAADVRREGGACRRDTYARGRSMKTLRDALRGARILAGMALSLIFALAVGASARGEAQHAEVPSITPAEALQRLVDGNERFAKGSAAHGHEDSAWRTQLTGGQHPFATIFGCSDSRVPSELVFDQGFGDLFVVRVAGNVGGPDDLGSIEYAVLHLHTPLVLVVGHESCGAVTAALEADSSRAHEAGGVQAMLAHVVPSLAGVNRSLPKPEQVHLGVEANVRRSVAMLRETPELKAKVASGALDIVGCVYELNTGKIRMVR
jgi:carbonic anhydrase